jgi:hypothetical protein
MSLGVVPAYAAALARKPGIYEAVLSAADLFLQFVPHKVICQVLFWAI